MKPNTMLLIGLAGLTGPAPAAATCVKLDRPLVTAEARRLQGGSLTHRREVPLATGYDAPRGGGKQRAVQRPTNADVSKELTAADKTKAKTPRQKQIAPTQKAAQKQIAPAQNK